MKSTYQFVCESSTASLKAIMEACQKSLVAPSDGMWDSFRVNAAQWGIYLDTELIGYAQVDAQGQLLQYYLTPQYLPDTLEVFSQFLQISGVKDGIVGTHQPVYLSTAMHFAQRSTIHTYLFESYLEVEVAERAGRLEMCSLNNFEQVVEFGHYSVGAPKAWLHTYFTGLIERQELFVLMDQERIIGTCEVRQSTTTLDCADIGMIVSPDYRRKGYGTYLLGRAKAVALKRGKQPICSCESGNTGSLKAIQANGFRSVNRLLGVSFSTVLA